MLGVFIRVVFGWQRRAAAREGVRDGQGGAVTVIQRFGSALNANVHFQLARARRRVHAVHADGRAGVSSAAAAHG